MGFTINFTDQFPTAHVVYLDEQGRVNELYTSRTNGWNHANLSGITHAPIGAVTVTGYTTNLPGQGPVARIVFLGNDYRIHEISAASGTGWKYANLSDITHGPAAEVSAPIGYTTNLAGQGPAARVVYRGTDGHIHELSFQPPTSGWRHADLSAMVH
jgi:hypothetical protein